MQRHVAPDAACSASDKDAFLTEGIGIEADRVIVVEEDGQQGGEESDEYEGFGISESRHGQANSELLHKMFQELGLFCIRRMAWL